MGRNLTNLYISQSFQFLTQISGSELQTGLGDTITGSLLITASLANTANTASYVLNAVSASHAATAISSSFATNATSASYATNALSSSFATTASYALNAGVTVDTGSLMKTGSVSLNTLTFTKGDGSTFSLTVDTGSAVTVNTGSLLVTASISNATTTYTKGDGSTFSLTTNNVVNATSASLAATATTASFAQTIADGLSPTFTNVTASNVLITGTASVAFLNTTIISSSVIFTSGSNQLGDNPTLDTQSLYGVVTVTGSFASTGSAGFTGGDFKVTDQTHNGEFDVDKVIIKTQGGTQFTGSVSSLNGFTGSLQGTASFADNATSASFASTANTASYVLNAVSASFATNATSASFANTSTSSSFSTTATSASYAATSTSSSFATNANTASYTPNAVVTASVSSNTITFTKGDASTFNLTVSTGSAGAAFPYTGSATISGSLILNGKIITGKPTNVNNGDATSAIIGGFSNTNSNTDTDGTDTILGGSGNVINANSNGYSAIIGSYESQTYDLNSNFGAMILASNGARNGGYFSVIAGTNNGVRIGNYANAFAIGGTQHQINGNYAGAIGGQNHTVNHQRSVVIGGLTISTAAEDTVYVPNLVVTGSTLGVVGNNSDTYTSSAKVNQIVTLTQAEYNAIGSPDANTLYVISGSVTQYAALSGSNTFVGNQVFSGSVRGDVSALTISSQTASLDLSTGNFFTLSLVSGSTTYLNPSNINPGQTVNIKIQQPAVSFGSIAFPSIVKQASGSAYTPTTSANAVDIITLISFDSTDLYLSNVKNLITPA